MTSRLLLCAAAQVPQLYVLARDAEESSTYLVTQTLLDKVYFAF